MSDNSIEVGWNLSIVTDEELSMVKAVRFDSSFVSFGGRINGGLLVGKVYEVYHTNIVHPHHIGLKGYNGVFPRNCFTIAELFCE